MGTCFGRCSCSCCDCLLLKIQPSRILVHRTAPKHQNFVMREHSSTIEFENLMYDYDVQEPCSSRLRLQPSISSWVKFSEDDYKISPIKVPKLEARISNKLPQIEEEHRYSMRRDLPIMDPLLSHSRDLLPDSARPNPADADHEDGESIIWERESVNSSSDVVHGATELEWDDYQDNLIFTEETDSLIREIEQMTAKALEEK